MERPDFYTERLVTARKPHNCCETGREIPKGERYWRIQLKCDGSIYTYAQSEAAYHFARHLNGIGHDGHAVDGSDGGCIDFGGVREYLLVDMDTFRVFEAEWNRVVRGEITRWTSPGDPPARVRLESTHAS